MKRRERFSGFGLTLGAKWVRTVLIVQLLADYVLNPGDVSRRTCEHRWLLVHDASNRTEAGDAVNFPRCTEGILAHQRTP